MKIRPGLWQHYKGGVYVVYGTAKHSETLETLILYHTYADPSNAWARPLEMWFETVEDKKGNHVPRFKWYHDQSI